MADIERTARAAWKGDLRNGYGNISSDSGELQDASYTYGTRFEKAPGTNPEELIAAAHAACYSMALAGTLKKHGYQPDSIETRAACLMTRQEGGGFKITGMQLQVRGTVADIDENTFKQIAREADQGCPVSNLLRCGLTIEHNVTLAT